MAVLAHSEYGPLLRSSFGDDVQELAIEQLQSDEESTDSEVGEVEKTTKLKVVKPSWRSDRVKKNCFWNMHIH